MSNPDISADNDLPFGSAQSEIYFNSLVNSSPDGIVVMNSEGTISYVNPASEIMFGRGKKDLLGLSFGYPVMSGDTTEIEILHPGKPPFVAEMRVVKVNCNGQVNLLATLRDVSERIHLRNELMRSNDELEKFASVVSHEIRAPLRNMHLLSGWLLEDHSVNLSADALEDVQLIWKTSTRMQRMVSDLLSYCRCGAQHTISPEVDLEEVLVDALDNLREEIDRSEAQVVRETLPTIDCDVTHMVTIFQHIISNAIVYCTEKPRIMVTASREHDMWKISFTDNGIGVEKKYWDKIFVPFNHLHSRDTYAGTGVGLATCKKMVELHRGRIWLESDPGVGSIVHLCLPESANTGNVIEHKFRQ